MPPPSASSRRSESRIAEVTDIRSGGVAGAGVAVEACASGEWDRLYDKYFGPNGVAPFEKSNALAVLPLMNAWPAE